MKHHVLLLQESIMLKGVYLVSEYNLTAEGNEIPHQGLADYESLMHSLTEIKPVLRQMGFLEVFSTIQQPNEQGKVVDIPIGQCTFIEMLLAGTAIITVFWFDVNGLPTHQTVYDMRIEER